MLDDLLDTLVAALDELKSGVNLDTGKSHVIKMDDPDGKLRFSLHTENGLEPLPNQDFMVEGQGQEFSGTTDENGLYEHEGLVPYGPYDLKVGEATQQVLASHPDDADDEDPQQVDVPSSAFGVLPDDQGTEDDEEEEEEEEQGGDEEEEDDDGPPIVELWAKLYDQEGGAPLAEVDWTVDLGDDGTRSGTTDTEGVLREGGVPLGHFFLKVSRKGAKDATISAVWDPDGPYEVRIPGVKPKDDPEPVTDPDSLAGVDDDYNAFEA
ncbi:carboxypeptidase-like regulatory domain-containing protein [Planctomycetota bacterium]|nr:carboxypeptidase-like regulatory domain-containing protein [Planctomycetota bacterium]